MSLGDEGAEVWDLQRKLVAYGYGLEVTGVYDDKTEKVVTAFQRHFRPQRVDGKADLSTRRNARRICWRRVSSRHARSG